MSQFVTSKSQVVFQKGEHRHGKRKSIDWGSAMDFEVIGEITDIETFAVGSSIRELPRLRRVYGSGRWRKRKGIATIRFTDGAIAKAEVHWYEAHGIGRKEMKIKQLLDD